MLGLCLITPPQSLVSVPWEVVSVQNATLLLKVSETGLGKEIFHCQQPLIVKNVTM